MLTRPATAPRTRLPTGARPMLGLAVLAIGVAITVAVQLHGHVMPRPLFDGVLLMEPYRYLDPPPGGASDPTHYRRVRRVPGGRFAFIQAHTHESPPQMQWYAEASDTDFGPNTKRYHASIVPVEPPAQPADGYLVGNAYQLTVTDPQGKPITARKHKRITLAFRAPVGVDPAIIAVFDVDDG